MSPWNASPWKLPVSVPKSVLDVINVAQKLRNTMQPFLGLSFHGYRPRSVEAGFVHEVRQSSGNCETWPLCILNFRCTDLFT